MGRACLAVLLTSFVASAADEIPDLSRVREVNLDYAAKLPNFVADETAKRYKGNKSDPPQWRLMNTVESEIDIHGHGPDSRRNIRLNGKPWNKPDYSDFNWGEPFGYELRPLFDPKCPTAIQFEGHEETRGKRLLAFRYHAPPDSCFQNFMVTSLFSRRNYNPAREGRSLIDDPGGNVTYFEELAGEFPKGFGADPWKQTSTWDYVQIGDASHLLPVAAEVFGGFTKGGLWHVVVEYKNHRHFEASTSFKVEPSTK